MQHLLDEEQKEKRTFLQKRDMEWNTNDVACAQFLYIGVQTLRWEPRCPIPKGKWFPQTRRLIQVTFFFSQLCTDPGVVEGGGDFGG